LELKNFRVVAVDSIFRYQDLLIEESDIMSWIYKELKNTFTTNMTCTVTVVYILKIGVILSNIVDQGLPFLLFYKSCQFFNYSVPLNQHINKYMLDMLFNRLCIL